MKEQDETPPQGTAAARAMSSEAGHNPQSVLRSGAVMAVGTIASRATGFVRNMMIVAALGSALFADAYTVGNSMPNILYILLLGGALNAVFVPQLVRAMKTDADGGEAFANRLLTGTMFLLFLITAAATVAAPLIVDVYSNFSGAQRSLTVAFARYCLPQIFFYGLFAMLGQILNARDRFGPMMWTPILNNVVVIAVFGAYLVVGASARSAEAMPAWGTRLLGIGTTLGIVVQAVALVPFLRRAGFSWRPRFDWRGAGMSKAARLGTWTVLVVLVNQLGYLVVTRLSTQASVIARQEGIDYGVGFTAYSSAYLLWIIPQGVVTVSLLTALMPKMSRAAAEGDLNSIRDDLSYGLRISGAFIVPAAFFFLALGPHITTVLFLRGNMTIEDTFSIGYMLSAFALGLIPFSAQYLLVRTFYAFEDTRTPLSIAVRIVAVNVALVVASFLLLPTRWAVTGMAAASGISYSAGLAVTGRRLGAVLGHLDGSRLRASLYRMMGAGAAAAATAFATGMAATRLVTGGYRASLVALTFGGLLFLIVFFLGARAFRIEEVSHLVQTVKARGWK